MERDDRVGELAGQPGMKPARTRHLRHQRFVGEAAHLEYPVDRLAVTVDRNLAIGRAGDRTNAEIELGRCAAVERELGLERRAPELGRGEIEIGKAHRALELPRPVAGEEYARRMRVDPVAAPIGPKSPAEEVDQCRLRLGEASPGRRIGMCTVAWPLGRPGAPVIACGCHRLISLTRFDGERIASGGGERIKQ